MDSSRFKMRRALAACLGLIFCLVVYPAPGAAANLRVAGRGDAPQAITADPVIQGILNQVTSSQVYSYTAGLTGEAPVIVGGNAVVLATRYTFANDQIDLATQYAFEHFQSLGLDVSYHSFTLQGTSHPRNVVAEQLGQVYPQKMYLITAHIDDDAGEPMNFAPGADDNASGSVGVLMAADLLSQYDFAYTIRYVLFSGEEQGCIGSEAYAAMLKRTGVNVVGVVNLDMIAYNTANSATLIDIHARPGKGSDIILANMYADVVAAYGLPLQPEILADGWSPSDSFSFWENGYNAILVEEDNDDFNPNYHTDWDRLGKLNLGYFTAAVKAAIGTLAHLSGLREGEVSGQVTDIITHQALDDVQITWQRDVEPSYISQTDTNGHYQTLLPEDSFRVHASRHGYDPFTSTMTVAAGQLNEYNFAMTPMSSTVRDLDFLYLPALPWATDPVVFTATFSSGSEPIQFDWNFGGTVASGASITHTFDLGGSYPVTLTAANRMGAVSVTRVVTVTNIAGIALEAPVMDFTLPAGEQLTTSMTITSTGLIDLQWQLSSEPPAAWVAAAASNGSLPPGQSARLDLTITSPWMYGEHTTRLVVRSNDPHHPYLETPLGLHVPCIPLGITAFSYAPSQPAAGQPVTFTATTSAGIPPITFRWSWGDTATASGETVTHTFGKPGSYLVFMTASNCGGVNLPVAHTVQVGPPVHAAQKVYLPLLKVNRSPAVFDIP